MKASLIILGKSARFRRLFIYVVGAAAVIGAGLVWLYPATLPGPVVTAIAPVLSIGRPIASAESTDAAPQASGLDAPSVPAPPDQCSFVAVRIDPTGRAVIAGHAEPSVIATIRDGSDTIGQAKADELGDWLLLTQQVLTPGIHLLSLEAARGDEPAHRARQMVVLQVAGGETHDGRASHAVALLVPEDGLGASTVLQAPDAALDAKPADPTKQQELKIDVIDYTTAGIVAIGGRAVPGAAIAVSIAGRASSSVEASPQGRWHIDVDSRISRARQTVRAEQRDAEGKVVAVDEKSFDENAGIGELSGAASERGIAVTDGEGFTRIARRVGRGAIQFALVYQRIPVGEESLPDSGQAIREDANQTASPVNAKTASPTP